MTAQVLYEIRCDCTDCRNCPCGNACSVDQFGTCGVAVADVGNAGQVRRRLKDGGWSVNRPGGQDLCWNCAQKGER